MVEDSHLHLLHLPHITATNDTSTRPHPHDSSINGSHAKAAPGTSASLLNGNSLEKGDEEADEEGAFETFNL